MADLSSENLAATAVKTESSVYREGQLLLMSLYAALAMTLISCIAVVLYKVGRDPSRYNHWFYSERTRKHAVAGALLMLGFAVPLATRADFHPVTVVIVALFYAFVFVPFASGLLDPRPFLHLVTNFYLWVFHSLLEFAICSYVTLSLTFKLFASFYLNNEMLQKLVRQVMFLHLCMEWLCPFPENVCLQFQMFCLCKFLDAIPRLFKKDILIRPSYFYPGFEVEIQSYINLMKIYLFGPLFVVSLFFVVPTPTLSFIAVTFVCFAISEIHIVPNSTCNHTLISLLKQCNIWALCELEFLIVPIAVDGLLILSSGIVLYLSGGFESNLMSAVFVFTNVVYPSFLLKVEG